MFLILEYRVLLNDEMVGGSRNVKLDVNSRELLKLDEVSS